MAFIDEALDTTPSATPETWQDRVREAAYTSPSGNRVAFVYENVSYRITRKGTAFNFPDANGTYVQGMGLTGRRFPLLIYFWGDNYDLNATNFESALGEAGTGKLEHPMYGVRNVVPFGEISRRDDLKTAANQAIFQVTFWDTIGVIYPQGQGDPSSAVLNSVDSFNAAASQQYASSVSLDTALEQTSGKNVVQKLIDDVDAGLTAIADFNESRSRAFRANIDSINNGIDVLIKKPLTLATQMVIAAQAPARAQALITDRLEAYQNLLNSLTTGPNAVQIPGLDSNNSNSFLSASLMGSAYVSSSILSVVNNTFETKGDALAAAEVVQAQFEQVNAWQEANYASLEPAGLVDTGEAYQALQEATAITIGFLTQISFSLKQERTIVLDRPRTIIDLAAELYGSIDDKLDFLINTNMLTGSEILELPAGRSIKYYV